ncbi:multidrug effflux MFS transporter [Legionella nagasakiensis]|uniref:multidrug effflux MFS transporter n=1 Tax=Legionella nagasakiensis TaxID=535290 RepID=UPI0010562A27|nr:multidrug effflux MFS transporter [Legionella nagasakiensis]
MIKTPGTAFVSLVIALFVYAWVSVNIYLPALPYLSQYFNTSDTNLKLSISLFLFGFAAAQLFWGSLSERYGRKKILIHALTINCIGVVIAMISPNIEVFISGRIIEAIGAGCIPVLGRALLLDYYEKSELAGIIATATILTNIMPAISPIIGGHLLTTLGWRSIFFVLLVYSFLLLFIFYREVEEKNRYLNKHLTVKQAILQYKSVFLNRTFWGYLMPYNLVTGGMLGYYAATPYIFIQHLHLAANVYGYLSLATVTTYILGAFISRKLSRRFGIDHALMVGIGLNTIAAFLLTGFAWIYPLSIMTVLLPMSFYTLSAGIISPNANAGAMGSVKNIVGAGNAIIGASVYAAGALLSFILTNLNLSRLLPLAIYAICIWGLSVFTYFTLSRQEKRA